MKSLMFGSLCVWLAIVSALASCILYLLVERGRENLRSWARLSYLVMAQSIVWAAISLMYLVLTHRYEVSYVAEYSSTDLRPLYLISSFWAGQQGTFFLWAIYGSVLGLLYMTRSRRKLEPLSMAVLSVIQGFLALLIAVSNPFALIPSSAIPADGQGLNVLLQNQWMVIHPPIMFLGFTALSLPFAIAVAALVRREYDEWIEIAWPWVLFAWCALGTGLFMGGYWAYTVLGWGGFWGWDNVENSSLIPWLATTALIHGLMLQRSRGSMKRSNFVFCLSPYIMVLFGSFLTRSGILADFSVHSFAAPARAIYNILLAYLIAFTVGTVLLFLIRVGNIPRKEAFEEEASRGFFFIIGAWTLYLMSLLVLTGTSWPLISRLWGKPGNPGQGFYDHWLFPVAILLCVMMGISPYMKWRGHPISGAGRALSASFVGAIILSLALGLANAAFYRQSLQAPPAALVRSNPSAYVDVQPSGILLNGRTAAAGSVTRPGSSDGVVLSEMGEQFRVPKMPRTLAQACIAVLHLPHGIAFLVFALAAFFCILCNLGMLWRITGGLRGSWGAAGGTITHIGVGVLLIGVITALNYGGDAVLNLNPGSGTEVAGNSAVYPNATPVSAFGHQFKFVGYSVSSDQQTAILRIQVKTGDRTEVSEPRLTRARDGNVVHFPGIFKLWDEDLYLSPIKLPGMGMELGFHAVVNLMSDSETQTLKPGITITDDGMQPSDTPEIGHTGYQLVLTNLQVPTQDNPGLPTIAELSLQRQGSFQESGAPTVRLLLGQSAALGHYRVRLVSCDADQNAAQAMKEFDMAQVEVSTKPLIDLVWLGTFLIIGGAAMGLWRRARGRSS